MAENRGMEDLIPIVNKLQDAYSSMGLPLELDLPQIAVVGSQSAGKTSVLENFVGRDFLPRGSGIVTRVPLVLQLIHSDSSEYAEFVHTEDKRYVNFDDVRKEIEAQTGRIAGNDKNVKNIPINLKVYSPHVMNLTLIDLPGLTKVALPGQPKDIADQIRSMVLHFIESPSCLILAVSPANSDIANSDALRIAREVDPDGVRTIGVLTKLDLMDQGTDAKDILENKLLPLRRGFIGIVNRSQRDIEGRKDIKAAMAAEKTFFQTHKSYKHLVHKMGTPYLQETLNRQLTNHIKEMLPSLRERLENELSHMRKEVDEIGTFESDDMSQKTKALLGYINDLRQSITEKVDGSKADDVSTKTLSSGAKINKVFYHRYPQELLKVELNETEMRNEIYYAIKNIHGVRSGLFTPDMAFEIIVKDQIARLHSPTMRCVDFVVDELLKISRDATSAVSRFPKLQEFLNSSMSKHIRECEKRTRDQLDLTLDIHKSYMNTNHEQFIGFSQASKAIKQNLGKDSQTPNMVLRVGYMTLQTTIFSQKKNLWFTLTMDLMGIAKDDEGKDKKEWPVNELRVSDKHDSYGKRYFTLVHMHTKSLYKEYKQLDVYPQSSEDAEKWSDAFLTAGLSIEKDKVDEPSKADYKDDDPLSEQIELVRTLSDSYLRIVKTAYKDIVPKTVMHMLVYEVKRYVDGGLLAAVYSQDMNVLLEESEMAKSRRKEVLHLFKTMNEALSIIKDISMNTTMTPLPPPIRDGHRETTPIPPSRRSPLSNGGSPSSTRRASPHIVGPPRSQSDPKISALQQPSRPAPTIPNRAPPQQAPPNLPPKPPSSTFYN